MRSQWDFCELSVLSHCIYCCILIASGILSWCICSVGLNLANETGVSPLWVERKRLKFTTMGSVCCCLHVEDFEDYMNPNSSVYRNCTCLGCFIQHFLNVVCFMHLLISLVFHLRLTFFNVSLTVCYKLMLP